ncbi:DNA primase catalytic core [Kribbella aluminosa]|uniref:DNA primase catalytic core n=1 Tax=Kribbella aluminosa TaxID=416017 RepID=A0ABS4UX53_9ACTN|nr:toprim domain-containing protein [Kribbella aluminosa]MBP2356198.1 DNA primase catalytic core [Kribbella aluminosa]
MVIGAMSCDDRRLMAVQVAAGQFFRQQLLQSVAGWAAAYLTRRGLGHVLRSTSRWKVGYAPDGWAYLVDHLRSQGFDDETLLASGLASATKKGYLIDRFRDRIMFPAWDSGQELVGFVGRSRGGRVKYLNSPATRIYQKSCTLVGLAEQRDLLEGGATPVFVEGPMDAVAVDELSRLTCRGWAGLGVCGTALSLHQVSMVRQYSDSDTVIVGVDADGAGSIAARRWLDDLSAVFKRVQVAEFPSGHDPSSLLETPAGADRLFKALNEPRPLAELAIEAEVARWSPVLDHISGRVNALRRVAPLVARLPQDRVAAQLGELAKVLQLDQEIVSREVLESVGRSAPRRRPHSPPYPIADTDLPDNLPTP